MIFSRYSSPFDLLDGYIQTGQFTSFISQFIDIHEEEKVWEIWLNKATGKTWGEFRDLVIPPEIGNAGYFIAQELTPILSSIGKSVLPIIKDALKSAKAIIEQLVPVIKNIWKFAEPVFKIVVDTRFQFLKPGLFVYFLIHLCSVELPIPYSLHICVLLFSGFIQAYYALLEFLCILGVFHVFLSFFLLLYHLSLFAVHFLV